MKIEYNSKFNLEDVAWCMVNNKPTPGVVTDIEFTFWANVRLTGSDCESIWKRIQRLFAKHRSEICITYNLTSLDQDGKFRCSGEMVRRNENELFATKEELLNSL